MSFIGNLIIISFLALGGSIGIVAGIKYLGKQPRRIIHVDQLTTNEQVIGDGAWIITAAEFPPSGVLRKEKEPRGM